MFRSLCCDCIATIQHLLTLSTHPLSLTLLPTSLILYIGTNSWSLLGRKLPLTLVVLTDWIPSFPRRHLQVSFDAAYLQDSSCQWFAYLPGLSLHVPRRLRKVADSNRLLILCSSENHRYARRWGQAFPLFQFCLFAPTIQAFTFLVFFRFFRRY